MKTRDIIRITKKYIVDDIDFQKAYIKAHKTMQRKDFKKTIDVLLDYCFYDYFDPYLDKEYLDYSFLRIWDDKIGKKYIINLDDIYECYCLDLGLDEKRG